jgi:acetyltransferase-like isoleucine patch superfamily enzyme
MENKKNYFVHEKGWCESSQIGEGTRVWAFSHIMSGAKIGNHCNVGEQVFIENKVVIGNHCTIKNGVAIWDEVTLQDGVFVGPNAVFTNDLRPRAFLKRGSQFYLPTLLKEGCTLGANVTIVCGVTIGEFAMVGAGSVVTRDVAPFTLVAGNPAKEIGRICFCGERLNPRDYCNFCQKLLSENSVPQTKARVEEMKLSRGTSVTPPRSDVTV